MRVDLSVFGSAGVVGFALVLTVAAVPGKQVCALGVRAMVALTTLLMPPLLVLRLGRSRAGVSPAASFRSR